MKTAISATGGKSLNTIQSSTRPDSAHQAKAAIGPTAAIIILSKTRGFFFPNKKNRLNNRCTKKTGENRISNQSTRWPANGETSTLHLQKQN
jgi:hypothetical protein